jgi:sorbose reductase
MSDGALDKHANFVVDNVRPAPTEPSVFNLFSLKGRTAIITGAGAGIGRAVAHAYAEAGANVAITYNKNRDAHVIAKEIKDLYHVKCESSKFPLRNIVDGITGPRLGHAYQLDVRSSESTTLVVDQIVRDFNGRLDIFVANSGIPWTQGAALGGDVQHYMDVVQTDLDGVFYSALAAGRHFRRQFLEGMDLNGKSLDLSYIGGSFIATASISGRIANIPQLQAAYNAAKAGVAHMCRSLAVEWVKFARVNSVSPGYIATEISNFIPEETKAIWKSKIPMG